MKKVFTLFLICQGLLAQSQISYLPGLIIDLQGDTIRGYLYNENPIKSGQYCTFKTETNAEPVRYYSNDLSGYCFLDGNSFIAKKIQIDTNNTERVFLQLIIKGKLSIYSYMTDKSKIYYFVETQMNQLIELKNTEVEIVNKWGDKYRYNKQEYVGILSSLMGNSEMTKMVNNTKLSDKSLIKLIKKYTELTSEDKSGVIFKKHKSTSEINLVIGKNWTNTNLNDISLFRHNEYHEWNSLHIGLGYRITNLSNSNRRISIQTGIYNNEYSLTVNERYIPEIVLEALQFPLLIGYSVYYKNFEPFLLAGLQTSYKYRIISNNPGIGEFNRVSIGPEVGIGIRYKISNKYIMEFTALNIYEYKSILAWQQHLGIIFSAELKIGYLF